MSNSPILLAIGTRPEAIKMCPLYRKLLENRIPTRLLVTGQHRALLDDVLSAFDITPDVDLHVMEDNQTPQAVLSRILSGIEQLLPALRPNLVLVHGDTVSALAVSLACFYHGIPIGHVEAGLRSGSLAAPFPEEMHRRLISELTTLHFAPTPEARDNLLRAGVDQSRIFVTGNTVVDALISSFTPDFSHPALDFVNGGPFVFFTAHRRENQRNLPRLFDAVREALAACPQVKMIFPVHPSPEVMRAATDAFVHCPQVLCLPPLAMRDCHNLLFRASLLVTDSGGMQEEGCAIGLPVLVMRDVTERGEGGEYGLTLIGTDPACVKARLIDAMHHLPPASVSGRIKANPFGDGNASARIARILKERYS